MGNDISYISLLIFDLIGQEWRQQFQYCCIGCIQVIHVYMYIYMYTIGCIG